MDRRVAQGRSPLASPNSYPSSTFVTVVGAACLVAIALVVYTVSHPDRYYNHFTCQPMAFLEGQAAIRYPVPPDGASLGNAFFQDVLPVASSDGVTTTGVAMKLRSRGQPAASSVESRSLRANAP